ncbi:MAG: peptidoglycan-binding protein [Actinomycetia bacterium]|nr:peptidoglycan-binding protein [Actinomycetes bacterium]
MTRHRFALGAAAAALVVGSATGTMLLADLAAGDTLSEADSAPGTEQEVVKVRLGDLIIDREFRARVSFTDRWSIPTTAVGTVTWHQEENSIVRFGDELIRVDDRPVFLAEGAMPMYRELSKVDTRRRDQNGDRLQLQTGDDVVQLQRFLASAGFDAEGELESDGEFGATTEQAVKDWQDAAGLEVTGRVDRAQLVFSETPVRVDAAPRIGSPFMELSVTNVDPMITVDTSNRDRSALPVGSTVEVVTSNGVSSTGRVTDQEQVRSDDGSMVWRTTITVTSDLGDISEATVEAATVLAERVLLVPVGSLLALAEGGFAVEVVGSDGVPVLTRVEVGEVVDGIAEVTGEISTGDDVIVAT